MKIDKNIQHIKQQNVDTMRIMSEGGGTLGE